MGGRANAKYTDDAIKKYAEIAERAVQAGIAIDIFACNLDQCGLYEMKVCVDKTGGYMVMSDSFSMHVFKQSLLKCFEKDEYEHLKQGFNCKIDVITSPDFKVCG